MEWLPVACSECRRAIKHGRMGRPRVTCSDACARARLSRMKREARHAKTQAGRAEREYWRELNAWIRDPKTRA